MYKRYRKGFIISLSVVIVLVIGVLLLNFFVKNKLKNSISHLSETIKITYQDIHVNSLTGSVALISPQVLIYGKTTRNINAKVELKKVSVSNLSYWDYFFNNKISIKNILLSDPKTIYYHNDTVTLKSSKNSYKESFKKSIDIETFEIVNGNVEIFNVSNDSLMLKSEEINFKVTAVSVKKSTLKNKIPVTFKTYHFRCNNVFYMLNDYEHLFVNQANLNTDFYDIRNITIKTKYSKQTLSKQIPVERDYFDLSIDSIVVDKPDFGVKNDSLFYFESKQTTFYQPNFKIHRDKLVADDPSIKALYSKSLRGLNFSLALKEVLLKNAAIVYTEKVREDTQGGKLSFSKLNAKINNLGNVYNGKNKTSVKINAVFMENTPLDVDWNFDVNDTTDEFLFKAAVGKLNAEHMNPFIEPNLNVRLEGEINKTYFTINGNNNTSYMDLKLQYDNFNVIVLKQNGKEKNKVLSGLVNLFVSKDSKDKSNEFRYGNGKEIERDKTKSVFNYLWLNVKTGLLNAMTGNGEENKTY